LFSARTWNGEKLPTVEQTLRHTTTNFPSPALLITKQKYLSCFRTRRQICGRALFAHRRSGFSCIDWMFLAFFLTSQWKKVGNPVGKCQRAAKGCAGSCCPINSAFRRGCFGPVEEVQSVSLFSLGGELFVFFFSGSVWGFVFGFLFPYICSIPWFSRGICTILQLLCLLCRG